jgi:hypothetical protein
MLSLALETHFLSALYVVFYLENQFFSRHIKVKAEEPFDPTPVSSFLPFQVAHFIFQVAHIGFNAIPITN